MPQKRKAPLLSRHAIDSGFFRMVYPEAICARRSGRKARTTCVVVVNSSQLWPMRRMMPRPPRSAPKMPKKMGNFEAVGSLFC